MQHRHRRQARDRATFARPAAASSALVGVQSNQYPRALDLAPPVPRGRHAGRRSAASTSAAASRCCRSCRRNCRRRSISASRSIAGEAEGRMADLLRDIDGGTREADLQLSERHARTWTAATFPILPRKVVTRVAGHYASFDAGRGCPFQCSFCTIINVQGRKSRYRTADDVEAHRARQCRAGHHALLHHRRQFRPQPQLGADPRPPDRAARAATASRSACCCRSTRSATRFRASSRRRRAPAAPPSSSGSRTSIPNR